MPALACVMGYSPCWKTVLGFAVAVSLLVGAVVISYRNTVQLLTVQLLDASQRVAHTHEVIAGLERILGDLTDAETGQRGYIVTGDETYLEAAHMPQTCMYAPPAKPDR